MGAPASERYSHTPVAGRREGAVSRPARCEERRLLGDIPDQVAAARVADIQRLLGSRRARRLRAAQAQRADVDVGINRRLQ